MYDLILYISVILYVLLDFFLPVCYKEYMESKDLCKLKCFFNKCYDAGCDVVYLKKLRFLINNYSFLREKIELSESNIDKLVQRLSKIVQKKYFLRFSANYNVGIFMPILFPILFNLFVILKNKTRRKY